MFDDWADTSLHLLLPKGSQIRSINVESFTQTLTYSHPPPFSHRYPNTYFHRALHRHTISLSLFLISLTNPNTHTPTYFLIILRRPVPSPSSYLPHILSLSFFLNISLSLLHTHIYLLTSVTRFGEISLFWQNLPKFWAIF